MSLLCLVAAFLCFAGSYAQSISDYECTFTVDSIDHSSNTVGKYFNFDVATVSAILSSSGATFPQGSTYNVFNSRTGQVVNVIMWNTVNGGSVGDGHGRLNSGAAPGDWQQGDVLAFDGITEYCNVGACPFEVLGIDHSFGASYEGQYFNFDVGTVSAILAPGGSAVNPFTTNTYYDVYNARTGQVANVVLWNTANGGTGGDGHGRLTNGAGPGDWEVGDILTFDGIETYCTTDSPTPTPTKNPTKSPTPGPTAPPSSAPTVDGCDFDLEEYLQTCYCQDSDVVIPPMNAAKSFPMNIVQHPATHASPTNVVGVGASHTADQIMFAVNVWGFILASLLVMNMCLMYKNKTHQYKVVDMDSAGEL